MNNYTDELMRLWQSEIDFEIRTMGDYGFCMTLFDDVNRVKAKWTLETLEQGIEWLVNKVLELYPDCEYSIERIRRINIMRDNLVDTDKFTFSTLQTMLWDNKGGRDE